MNFRTENGIELEYGCVKQSILLCGGYLRFLVLRFYDGFGVVAVGALLQVVRNLSGATRLLPIF